MLSSPKNPPSKTFCPLVSLRFTHLNGERLVKGERTNSKNSPHQVKFKSSFWNTRSRKGMSSRPCSFLSILKTRNVALGKYQCTPLLRQNLPYQACTGGLTSPKFHSYAGIWPSGFIYHSRVSKSSCLLANEGSTTANGIQWNAVSHAAKNGYSHLNQAVKKLKTTKVARTHLSGMESMSATCMCGQSYNMCQHQALSRRKPRLPCFGHFFVRGEVVAGVDLRLTTPFE